MSVFKGLEIKTPQKNCVYPTKKLCIPHKKTVYTPQKNLLVVGYCDIIKARRNTFRRENLHAYLKTLKGAYFYV